MSDDYEHALGGLRGHIVYGEQTAGDTPVDWVQVKVALPYLRDAERALIAERARAEAAEAECARLCSERDAALADVTYWREQATAAAPCVDAVRALTRLVIPGGTGCALDPERVVAAVDAARAEAAGLRAIVEGRSEAPTDAEIDAHAAAGGGWIVRWVMGITTQVIIGDEFGTVHRANDVRQWRDATPCEVLRWWPLDAAGRPCAWPTVTP